MKKTFLVAGILPALFYANTATATVVNSFDPALTAAYQWYDKDTALAGTIGIEDLSGQGGNLENNAPLGSGAAKLTTGPTDTNDRAQVGIKGNLGSVSDFINGGSLSYDYYKSSSDVNAAAAPAIKLEILDNSTPDPTDYGTFVFEPYWNIDHPSSTDPATDTWTNIDITGTSGTFWHTAYYGDVNQAGGGHLGNTLEDWAAYFGVDFLDAAIVGIAVGVGTYNLGQTGYFDDVTYVNGNVSLAYDFEVSVVPLPAAFPLYGAGLTVLGFMAWRKKRKISDNNE